MKCPNCSFVQPDGKKECPHCGVIFERWRQANGSLAPKSTKRTRSGKLALVASALAIISVAGIGLGNSGAGGATHSAAAKTKLKESSPNRTSPTSPVRDNLTEVCIQGLMQMGSDRTGALASCAKDKNALAEVDQRGKDYEKSMHLVPAAAVARVEVLLDPRDSNHDRRFNTVNLYFVFYNSKGEPVSSEGALTLNVTPIEANVQQVTREITRNNFTAGPLPGYPEVVLSGTTFPIYIDSKAVSGMDVDFEVSFDDRVNGSQRFSFPTVD